MRIIPWTDSIHDKGVFKVPCDVCRDVMWLISPESRSEKKN